MLCILINIQNQKKLRIIQYAKINKKYTIYIHSESVKYLRYILARSGMKSSFILVTKTMDGFILLVTSSSSINIHLQLLQESKLISQKQDTSGSKIHFFSVQGDFLRNCSFRMLHSIQSPETVNVASRTAQHIKQCQQKTIGLEGIIPGQLYWEQHCSNDLLSKTASGVPYI